MKKYKPTSLGSLTVAATAESKFQSVPDAMLSDAA
jgi:hypothetical protein